MGLGKRVRICRPPPGNIEWMDKKATVVHLLPIVKKSLQYSIRFDHDSTVYSIPGDCLEPLHIEEVIEDGPYACCVVNEIMYCREHRLEVCGSCCVDHRTTNYQEEMSNIEDIDELMDTVNILLDGMKRIGAPGRRAPSKKSKKNTPMANKAIFCPTVNANLVIVEKEVFDPSALEPWPRERPTYQAAFNASVFNVAEDGISDSYKLPVRRMRENIVIAGKQWDRFLLQRSDGEPMCRTLLQDDAQTQVLTLDLVLPIRTLTVRGQVMPVFVVRFAHSLASSMEAAFAVMGTMERNTKMGTIPVEVDEIELMAALLRRNAEKLDPSFVRSIEKDPHVLSVSFLTPISDNAQINFYKSLGDYCHQCGTSEVAVQKCSQCLQAAYCSRECQRKNWKFHRGFCKK